MGLQPSPANAQGLRLVAPLRQMVVYALQEPQEQGQDPAGPPGQAKGLMALPSQESELEPCLPPALVPTRQVLSLFFLMGKPQQEGWGGPAQAPKMQQVPEQVLGPAPEVYPDLALGLVL